MKVNCPECHHVIPAADVALDKGWAKCGRCDEVFPLADLLPGYPAAAAVELPKRPFDARAIVRREPHMMAVHLPAQGLRAAALGLLFFATIWLAFIAFWTVGALGVFFNNGQVKADNAWFAAFSIPFWLIGFGMLGGVAWIAHSQRSVMIDAAQVVTEMRCLFWHRIRTFERDEVQCARAGHSTVKQEGAPPTPHCEIIFTKGSFVLPCTSTAEQAWLVAEVNDFLQSVPYDPRRRDLAVDPFANPPAFEKN